MLADGVMASTSSIGRCVVEMTYSGTGNFLPSFHGQLFSFLIQFEPTESSEVNDFFGVDFQTIWYGKS